MRIIYYIILYVRVQYNQCNVTKYILFFFFFFFFTLKAHYVAFYSN